MSTKTNTDSGITLITGATGNVGSTVLANLVEAGHGVRALVRDESKAQSVRDAGAEVVIGDLDNPDTLAAAFDGIDKVLLLTAPNPNAATQASNAIAAASQAGVSHVVRLSALFIDENGPARVGRLHAVTENELKSSDLPYTIVRAQFFMQNLLLAAPTVVSDGAVYMPMKDGRIGMVDARDIADAISTILTSDGHLGKTYTITGPASESFDDVAKAFADALDKPVNYIDVPLEAAREGMIAAGFGEWFAGAMTEYFGLFREGAAELTTDDFETLTGHPARSLETFARDFAPAFGAKTAQAA